MHHCSVATLLLVLPLHLAAQRPSTPPPVVALTPAMERVAALLWPRVTGPLERWGKTFYAYAAVLPDSAGALPHEVGVRSAPAVQTPGVIADSLRSALKQGSAYLAATVGVLWDSISVPLDSVYDGIEGPQVPRWAIFELEDRTGRCVRVWRAYHFERRPKSRSPNGHWGFGYVLLGQPRVEACKPRGYWSAPVRGR